MAAKTPEQAVDAFVARVQSTFSCLSNATVVPSGITPGRDQALTLYVPGASQPNHVALTTHGGVGEISFRFAHAYTVTREPGDTKQEPYKVSTRHYQYRILDIAGREIVIYDWHPSGSSSFTTPHVHVPGAGAITLAQRPGNPRLGVKTHLGDMHLPTAHIVLEDVVELLIRDFQVDPQRSNWESVLRDNREAIEHDCAG